MSEQPQGTPSSSPVSPVSPASPGAPRPITVRLKPVTKPATPVMPPVKPVIDESAALEQPAPEQAPVVEASTPTVVLKPIAPAAAPVAPVSPVAPKPVSPLNGVQAQAAKSKTSRITLDSAIGVSPSIPIAASNEPKTIRLKRPTDLAAPAPAAAIQTPSAKSGTAPIRQTSRIPDAVVESAAAEAATVTQKKTLKIKRPGVSVDPAGISEGGDSGSSDFAGVQMTPLTDLTSLPEESQGSKIFTLIAVGAAAASLVLGFALMWCLLASGVGPAAGPNNTASVGGPELFWPGRMN